MGASGFLWSTATIVGPWLGTTLYAWHPPALWWTAAGAGLASAGAVRYALRPVRTPAADPNAGAFGDKGTRVSG